MTVYYQGKIVPKLNGVGMEMNCFNSLCHGVDCSECINLPIEKVVNIKFDYLQEKNRDEYISEGIERVSNVREDEGLQGLGDESTLWP